MLTTSQACWLASPRPRFTHSSAHAERRTAPEPAFACATDSASFAWPPRSSSCSIVAHSHATAQGRSPCWSHTSNAPHCRRDALVFGFAFRACDSAYERPTHTARSFMSIIFTGDAMQHPQQHVKWYAHASSR